MGLADVLFKDFRLLIIVADVINRKNYFCMYMNVHKSAYTRMHNKLSKIRKNRKQFKRACICLKLKKSVGGGGSD